MWAELVCARNPWAALASLEMTAKALWRLQGRCSWPRSEILWFFYFKCFLSGFGTDISWACGGRGFSLTLPFSPGVLPRDCHSTPAAHRGGCSPIPPSAQSRCRACSPIWAGDVISHLLLKFLPCEKLQQRGEGMEGAGRERPLASSSLRSGCALLLSCSRLAAFPRCLF